MIEVTIKLVSAVSRERDQTLGVMLIANDGTHASVERGNYDVRVLRKGQSPDFTQGPSRATWDAAKTTRTGRVEDYPRLSYNVWRLIARALLSAFPEESPRAPLPPPLPPR